MDPRRLRVPLRRAGVARAALRRARHARQSRSIRPAASTSHGTETVDVIDERDLAARLTGREDKRQKVSHRAMHTVRPSMNRHGLADKCSAGFMLSL